MEVMVIPGMTANNMPELPEVETVKNVLKEIVLNHTIKSVDVVRPETVRSDVKEFKEKLVGATIKDFSRVGKYIVFHFDRDFYLLSHLRMEGKYYHREEKYLPNHNDLIIFHFTDGTYLAFNDTRRFGTMEIVPTENYLNRDPLNKIGPDPFMMKDASRLYEAFKDKNVAIKPCLLDQSVMSGLGNIYVDEVLFACKIHPETPAKLITREQYEEILFYSRDIMGRAISKGGTTIISYHPREGINGEFRFELKVYGQNGGKCVNCGTPLRKKFVNGRGTTFCPKCQINLGKPYVVGVTGPVGSGKSTVAKILEEKGFVRISADEIVHELYKDKKYQQFLVKLVPNLNFINGEVDRNYLREYLLKNPQVRRQIEEVVHRSVLTKINNQIRKINPKQRVVVEVPLLFESGFDDKCDDVIYVDVNEKEQIRHLEKRNSPTEQLRQLNSNFNVRNIKKATSVVINNGTIANLKKQINLIYGK